jgi:hypothetical protein
VKRALSGLGDLLTESREEARTVEELKRENRRLKAENRKLSEGGASSFEVEELEGRCAQTEQALEEATRELGELQGQVVGMVPGGEIFGVLDSIHQEVGSLLEDVSKRLEAARNPPPLPKRSVAKKVETWRGARKVVAKPSVTPVREGSSLGSGAVMMLTKLAEVCPMKVTWGQLAQLTGRKARGGAWNTARKEMRESGLIEEAGEIVSLSGAGMSEYGVLGETTMAPEDRVEMWRGALGTTSKFFDFLLDAYPSPTSRENLARALGVAPRGGSWNTHMAKLRQNGLVDETSGGLVVSDWVVS